MIAEEDSKTIWLRKGFMCHVSCIEFVRTNLTRKEVEGKSVLEVGSLNVNGSVRPIVEAFGPSSYIGVDIQKGPGVDEICNANDIASHFGQGKFDLLISTELLEHVRDWKKVISNFKNVLKPEGLLFITTRSKGFGYHGFPFDYWRFEVSDMRDMFSDFIIESIENDPIAPGVFLRARKPEFFLENNTRGFSVLTIMTGKREKNISSLKMFLFRVKQRLFPIVSKLLPPRLNGMLGDLYNKLQKS
jgi:SAM-dependent methyltransferase